MKAQEVSTIHKELLATRKFRVREVVFILRVKEIVFSRESAPISYPISYINNVVCMYVFKTDYTYMRYTLTSV